MQSFTTPASVDQLSSRNLSILEDQLAQESIMVLKLRQYSRQCQDSELKNLCNRLAEKHRNHYNSLLNYINSHDTKQ
jgi:hypothetical protein